jgi:hypothetical protein
MGIEVILMGEKRQRPVLNKGEMKQIHFDVDINLFLLIEKKVYSKGYKVAEYFRKIMKEEIGDEIR